MKKIIVLVVSVAALIGLIYFAIDLSKNQGKSDTELIEFAIEDIESVDKVIITDKFDHTFEIRKTDGVWTDKNGGCITQEKVDHVLDAFKNIEFSGYLADNSKDKFTQLMSAQHIKVEIFQNGEWSKTWFIGPSSQDHQGQIMLLDDREEGKSAFPVIMALSNMKGIIDPRFYADPLQWMCSDLISLQLSEISSVKVKFNDEPIRSFSVTKNGADMKVYQQGKLLNGVTPSAIYEYLSNFQKINFNVANYELNALQMDSLKRTTPFCVLKVKSLKEKEKTFKMYRIVNTQPEMAGNAEIKDIDVDRFWCEIPSGELVKCQYFVFNKIIFGSAFFPMDLSGIKTHDGLIPIEE